MTDVSFSERPDIHPKIYAYEDSNQKYSGLLKIGYTTIDVDKRLEQQGKTLYFARVREMRVVCNEFIIECRTVAAKWKYIIYSHLPC